MSLALTLRAGDPARFATPLLARVQLANLNVTNRVNGGVLEGQTQTMTGRLIRAGR